MDRKTTSVLKPAKYWEVREGTQTHTLLRVSNGEVKEIDRSKGKGRSVRVLVNGSWGFAYSDSLALHDIARRALRLARAVESKRHDVVELKPRKMHFRVKPKIDPDDVSPELTVKRLKKAHREVSRDKLVRNTAFDYQTVRRDIRYENCEGTAGNQSLLYTTTGASIGTKSGSKSEQYDARVGRQGGHEIFSEGFGDMVKKSLQIAKELLKARIPKGGSFPVVCDPVLVDVLIHEAFGHASEADAVLKGESCLTGRVGERLAYEEVTIADDPTVKNAWGSYAFDDEGVKAKKAVILDKGVLKGFMHSRETAAALGAEPTGHARAEGISAVPIVRMSNTTLAAGSASGDELFEGIQNGMYLCGSAGGQVDVAKGNFQFNAKYGYRIVNGELASPIKGVSLSGNTLKMLHDIDKVGRKVSYAMPGYCGKYGQMVPVVGINPRVSLSKASVGGR